VFNNAGIDLQTDATGAFGGKFFVSDVIFQDLDGQGIVAQNHIDSTQATELGLQGIHLFNIGANGLSVHSTPSCSSIANVATVRLDNVECVTSAYDGFNFSAVGDIFADNVTAANINTTNSSSHVFFYANGQNTVQANNIKILDLNNPARAYTYGENSTADYGNFTNITSYLPHGTLTPSIGSGSKIDLYGKLGKDFRLPAVTTAFFPSYADGPAALAGGLTADDLYVNTTWGHIARAGVGGAVPNNYPVYSVNTQQGAVVITGASLGLTFSDIGGVASVGQIPTIPSSKVTGLAAVATSGSASDITTGTLPSAQLPAGPATSVSCGMAGGTPVATVTVTADSHGRLTGVTCAP
jgi:hypothetical protein